jgi:hypothetical protein
VFPDLAAFPAMFSSRADALEIIHEDDETDEGTASLDGSTSLYGHPDHEHEGKEEEVVVGAQSGPVQGGDVRALEAENGVLRENVAALVREVERADAEMARWRSRCRKIEDERDALSRELDRFNAEFERRTTATTATTTAAVRAPQTRHHRPQSMIVYSTSRETFDADAVRLIILITRTSLTQSTLYRLP